MLKFYGDKINTINNIYKIKNNFRVIVPLFYNKTLIKKEFDEKLLISNFGYTFEENIIMLQKGDSLLENNISTLLFNIACIMKQLSEISISNHLKVLPKLNDLTEIKKIDNQLKSIIGKYNFIINNVNFDDELLLNKENILKPKDFINSLSEIEILLIGEQHFINEQEQFLINFYDEILKKGFNTICLEVPEKNQINLNLFMEGKNEALDENICMMRDFIFKIRELKNENHDVKIYCADFDTSSLNKKEDFLKREIKLYNIDSIKQASDSKILCILGNYHVQKIKKFYFFRNDETCTVAQMLSDKYKCMSINTFGLSGEEKVGPINCKIRYKFNNNDIFKEFINQDDDTFLLKYPYKSNKTVFLDSNTYITIDKNHNSPFDYSLIFKNQFVSSWSYLYEK